MTNAMVVQGHHAEAAEVDELAALRAEKALRTPGLGREEESLEKRRKRQKKDSKERERKEGDVRASSSKKLRMKAKKELKEVFGATGMDPDPAARRKFRAEPGE